MLCCRNPLLKIDGCYSVKNLTVCYFGIYKPGMARNRVYLRGLKQNGVGVIHCFDEAPFLLKYLRLIQKHWQIRRDYDVLMVGYLSNVAVPLAKVISSRPIVYNALSTLYEASVHDRSFTKPLSFKGIKAWLIDYLALQLSDVILVESHEQKKFISGNFYVREKKMIQTWTGADDTVFFPGSDVAKKPGFTAVFRGGFLPATGVEVVIEAARMLKGSGVAFLILGRGMLKDKIQERIDRYGLNHVELVTDYLPDDELRKRMLSCHVCLGQFSGHDRLDRTVQNKTFEALALGLPYITRVSASNSELMEEGKHCLFVPPEDPEALAETILSLNKNRDLCRSLSERGYGLFCKELCPRSIGEKLLKIIQDIID